MIHLIESHGIEVLIAYYVLISTLGTLPPLPDNATYLQRWAFAAAHTICGNASKVMQALGQTPKE